MARTVELTEDERRLLARLTHDEWTRLNGIREGRVLWEDPILQEQQEIEALQAKLR